MEIGTFIDGLLIKNGDFPVRYVSHYQRVNYFSASFWGLLLTPSFIHYTHKNHLRVERIGSGSVPMGFSSDIFPANPGTGRFLKFQEFHRCWVDIPGVMLVGL